MVRFCIGSTQDSGSKFPQEDDLFLKKRLPGQDISPALLDNVLRESCGNPFYLDIISANMEQAPQENHVSRAEDILHSYLSSLPREERRLLDLISLFPHGTDIDTLLAVTGTEPMDLVEMLDLLVRKDFLTELDHGHHDSFLFRHPKMQEYVQSELSPAKRHMYHRCIADVLANRHEPATIVWYSQLIHHYEAAGLPAKSLYYRILHVEALSNFNYDLYPVVPSAMETASSADTALLEELNMLERELAHCYAAYPGQISYEEASCILALTKGRICIQQGDYDTGRSVLLKHLNGKYVSSHLEVCRSYHRQLIYYGIQTWNMKVMQDSLSVCLKIDQLLKDLPEQAVDHRLQGLYYSMSNDFKTSDQLLKTAIEEFRNIPLRDSFYVVNLAASFNYLGENARKQLQFEQSICHYKKALSLCRENGLRENPTFYVNLARTYISLQDYSHAEEMLKRARALYDSSNVQMCRSLSYVCESFVQYKLGDFPGSLEALRFADRTYGILDSPRDALFYYAISAYLKKKEPDVYGEVLPAESEFYRTKAAAIRDQYAHTSLMPPFIESVL